MVNLRKCKECIRGFSAITCELEKASEPTNENPLANLELIKPSLRFLVRKNCISKSVKDKTLDALGTARKTFQAGDVWNFTIALDELDEEILDEVAKGCKK